MKLCEYCMAEFEPKRPDQKYCRPKCAKRYAQFKNFKKGWKNCVYKNMPEMRQAVYDDR